MAGSEWRECIAPGGPLLEVIVRRRGGDGGIVIMQAFDQLHSTRICHTTNGSVTH